MNFIIRLENFILSLLIVLIFGVTLFFVLDIMEIIDVPEKYSLATYIYSNTNTVATMDVPSRVDEPVPAEYVVNTVTDDFAKGEEIGETYSGGAFDPSLLDKSYTIDQTVESPNVSDVNADRLYYNQLDMYGQKIYDSILDHKEDMKSGVYVIDFGKDFNELLHTETGSDVLNNSFQLGVNAVMFDHPEIFYIDITNIYLMTEVTTRAFSKTYEVSLGSNGTSYLYPEFQNGKLNDAIASVEAVRDNVKDTLEGYDDYTKIISVHDFIVNNAEYEKNPTSQNVYNMYGALIDYKAVCEGYAKGFKYLMDTLNIPCVVACGIGTNNEGNTENHAWNYVYINDRWYALDSTWDDPIIIGYGKVTDSIRYHYFLKGSNSFFTDHTEDGKIIDSSSFSYPKISEEDF